MLYLEELLSLAQLSKTHWYGRNENGTLKLTTDVREGTSPEEFKKKAQELGAENWKVTHTANELDYWEISLPKMPLVLRQWAFPSLQVVVESDRVLLYYGKATLPCITIEE